MQGFSVKGLKSHGPALGLLAGRHLARTMARRPLSLVPSRFYVFTSYSWRKRRPQERADGEDELATAARAVAASAVTGAIGRGEGQGSHRRGRRIGAEALLSACWRGASGPILATGFALVLGPGPVTRRSSF